jgi:hypothetical protein
VFELISVTIEPTNFVVDGARGDQNASHAALKVPWIEVNCAVVRPTAAVCHSVTFTASRPDPMS